MRPYKCRGCKEYFRPPELSPGVRHCSPECGTAILEKKWAKDKEYAKRAQERAKKAQKKVNARKKREFYENDTKRRREAATKFFNRYIRLRDSGNPCISCGTTKPDIQYAAGHFIPAGNCTALRFHERNVHRQCNVYCNNHKSGNRVKYRESLITKFGQETVDFLEGPQPTIKITVDFYKAIEEKYKLKCKEMENAIEVRS